MCEEKIKMKELLIKITHNLSWVNEEEELSFEEL